MHVLHASDTTQLQHCSRSTRNNPCSRVTGVCASHVCRGPSTEHDTYTRWLVCPVSGPFISSTPLDGAVDGVQPRPCVANFEKMEHGVRYWCAECNHFSYSKPFCSWKSRAVQLQCALEYILGTFSFKNNRNGRVPDANKAWPYHTYKRAEVWPKHTTTLGESLLITQLL